MRTFSYPREGFLFEAPVDVDVWLVAKRGPLGDHFSGFVAHFESRNSTPFALIELRVSDQPDSTEQNAYAAGCYRIAEWLPSGSKATVHCRYDGAVKAINGRIYNWIDCDFKRPDGIPLSQAAAWRRYAEALGILTGTPRIQINACHWPKKRNKEHYEELHRILTDEIASTIRRSRGNE